MRRQHSERNHSWQYHGTCLRRAVLFARKFPCHQIGGPAQLRKLGIAPKINEGPARPNRLEDLVGPIPTSQSSYCMLEAQAPIGLSSEPPCCHPAFVDLGIRRRIHQGRPIEINCWNVKAGMTYRLDSFAKVESKRFIQTWGCVSFIWLQFVVIPG